MENSEQSQQNVKNNEAAEPNTSETVAGENALDSAFAAEGQALEKLQADMTETKDKYIRLYSEFENFRRRTAKEKLDLIQSANEELIRSLLPVADDFERAEKVLRDKNDKEAEGFALIRNKFKKVLDQYGVKVMEVKPGSDLNVDQHEAITQVPAPSEKLKGKIVDVVESGYLLNDKVVRFAKVVIGS